MKRLRRLWFENTGTLPSAVDLEELYELLKEQQPKKKKKLGLVFTIKTPNPHGKWYKWGLGWFREEWNAVVETVFKHEKANARKSDLLVLLRPLNIYYIKWCPDRPTRFLSEPLAKIPISYWQFKGFRAGQDVTHRLGMKVKKFKRWSGPTWLHLVGVWI